MSPLWMIVVAAAVLFSTSASGEAASQAVMLQASDGVSISGLVYTAEHPRAIVLLFHQAEFEQSRVRDHCAAPSRCGLYSSRD